MLNVKILNKMYKNKIKYAEVRYLRGLARLDNAKDTDIDFLTLEYHKELAGINNWYYLSKKQARTNLVKYVRRNL